MGPLAAAAIPIAGNLLSLGVQNILGNRDRNKANKYNDPRSQIARLRNAGVSPSQFYSGGGLVNASVQKPTPNISPDFGAAKGVEAYQKRTQINMQEKIAQLQMQDMETAIAGKQIDNQIKSKELNRYDADRDFNIQISKNKDIRDSDQAAFIRSIEQQRMQNAQMGQKLNNDKFAYEKNLKDRQFDLQKQGSEFQQKVKLQQYVLDAARLAIQQGQLDISQEKLQIEWKKYNSDYALWNAINDAFEGKLNSEATTQEILKTTGKQLPKIVLQGLRKFFQ